jgi:hypothetical protein
MRERERLLEGLFFYVTARNPFRGPAPVRPVALGGLARARAWEYVDQGYGASAPWRE